MRVLVGGVGYRNLRDHSVGVEVVDRLAARGWPAGVVIEDLSYNPIAVVQRLEDERARPFDRAIFVSAVARGRPPASVATYRWDRVLPAAEEIQRAVTEAVTGIISLDNTLVVAGHFGTLPADVAVVEIEPATEDFGDTFSAAVAARVDGICDAVARLAMDAGAAAALPEAALGGIRPRPVARTP